MTRLNSVIYLFLFLIVLVDSNEVTLTNIEIKKLKNRPLQP
uniref:Uncharacterized protein n=1 Tax=Rhizophora mucronata TaxID=61149 RepID=A0A2P2MLP9_RHIMU